MKALPAQDSTIIQIRLITYPSDYEHQKLGFSKFSTLLPRNFFQQEEATLILAFGELQIMQGTEVQYREKLANLNITYLANILASSSTISVKSQYLPTTIFAHRSPLKRYFPSLSTIDYVIPSRTDWEKLLLHLPAS